MPYRPNYPASVAEVLDPAMTFRPAALRAVRALARSRPWRGSVAVRALKLQACLIELSAAYGLRLPALSVVPGAADCYRPAAHEIVLGERLSVVTFLHEFAHARGHDERQACRWSLNLFRRCFPRSFARCRAVGHTLVRD
jgi:hypothetical protein